MTQWARPDTVHANFDNVGLHFDGKTYDLSKDGGEYRVELEDPDEDGPTSISLPRVSRRIGMLTGSHHMQLFWVPTVPGNLQIGMPFMYLLEDHRWVPAVDTFLRDPKLPRNTDFWNFNCIRCHTTAGEPGVHREERTIDTELGEMGIGCESCHGPAGDHTQANLNPLRRYELCLRGKDDPTIVNPTKMSPKAASEICGQCHSVFGLRKQERYSGNPYRPGSDLAKSVMVIQPTRAKTDPTIAAILQREPDLIAHMFWPDGKIRISGRDYNGLIDSPCYQRGDLSCLSCHSMHHSSPINQLRAGMDGNQACVQCHQQFVGDKLVQHTHHAANSSGSLCYNCHMPYTTYGLLKAIRSHFIENPNVMTSVSSGRPNGCNLCHLDRSLGWTDDHLVSWYGAKPTALTPAQRTISASVLWTLQGDAGQRALLAWAMGWAPARQASGQNWLVPYLAQDLVDPYPAVRYIAGHSLQHIEGYEHFPYDFVASPSDLDRARWEALEAWRRGPKPERLGPDVLITNDGQLQENELNILLKQRDDRSMDLQE